MELPGLPVAVLGLGTMGHGIAQTMAAAGCHVRAFDASASARSSTLSRIEANLLQMVEVGIVADNEIPQVLERITVCDTEQAATQDARFVTEAVSEDLAVKQELFVRLETQVDDETLLASNTSSYPMTDIAARMRLPGRAIVTHWFNPPHIVPVVEVVPGQQTTPETTQAACDALEQMGKQPVRLNQEIPGFLVNRVQNAMFREIWDLLDRGVASADQIDAAIRGSMGLRLAALGPLAIIDFAGWDITTRVFQNLIPDMRSDRELPERVAGLVRDGHYGVKTGQGVFDYPGDAAERQIADRDRDFLKLVKLLHRRE